MSLYTPNGFLKSLLPKYGGHEPCKILHSINDSTSITLKKNWFKNSQKIISHEEFLDKAQQWFKSTKLNQLEGWNAFPCVDIIMGCTHYIESLCLKYKWNIQVISKDNAYYSLMGKQPTQIGNLQPNIPLIISLPNWYYGDIHPQWNDILKECEQKNIAIHVDCAWVTVSKDFNFNFDHPNIKSFAMSMSKYNMTWNRIGLRWSRQRTMDSCTLISTQRKYNQATTSCGAYIMDNMERDYGWNIYRKYNEQICKDFDLQSTNLIYVVKRKQTKDVFSIGPMLGSERIKLISQRH